MEETVDGKRFFDENYAELVTLRDGTQVRLRKIRPEDKALFVEGLRELSPRSRYLRFHEPRSSLSPTELVYLTEVDGERHFAIGALDESADPPRGLAVARFVVLDCSEPTVAEAACVVLDAAQGKGLGSVLLLRLAAAALERGVDVFRNEVLPENESMMGLLTQLFPEATVAKKDSWCVTIDCKLRPPEQVAARTRKGPLERLLALAAEKKAFRMLARLPRMAGAAVGVANPSPEPASSGQTSPSDSGEHSG